MKTNFISVVLSLFLYACGGGGGSNSAPPIGDIPLDGIYRGSPVVVSANNMTYDYDDPAPGAWQRLGDSGRIYETTVNGELIDGTASIYRGGTVTTQNLDGTISTTGEMTLNFVDGPQRVNLTVQRLAEVFVEPKGKAWCSFEFDNVTVHNCGEVDVVDSMTFFSPAHGGTANQVHLTLGAEADVNVYEASIQWEPCGTMSGVVGIAVSEDGLEYEMSVNMAGGSCGYHWWLLTSVR